MVKGKIGMNRVEKEGASKKQKLWMKECVSSLNFGDSTKLMWCSACKIPCGNQ